MKVLIVEDDEAIANLLYMDLSDEGYDCTCVYNGKTAADLLEENGDFDFILLDVMLPEVDGYELMEYIRPMEIPVIFLTARGAVNDRIKGLKLGADDYMVKPFQSGEVLARMEAVLRRYGRDKKELAFADVTVSLSCRKAFQNGREVDLTVKEFDILHFLASYPGIVFTKAQIYERVWREDFSLTSTSVSDHISSLRQKLGLNARDGRYIQTVFGVGYRFIAGPSGS